MKVNLSLSPSGAGAAVDDALRAWTGVSGSSFKFRNDGPTSSGGMGFDRVNAISFGDPRGQITPPTQSAYVHPTSGKPYCSGVLAIGGYYRSGSESDSKTVNGQKYYKIMEGDLVFADGWENCHNGFDNSLNVAEVTTHELGHVIGLGHSADTTATMYAYAHFDSRGASIRQDDIAGLRAIYPGADSTPTPSPCSFTLSTATPNLGSSATTTNVTLTASASNCAWTASSNATWATFPSGLDGSGSATIPVAIAANTSTSARTVTLTIAEHSITLTQAGLPQATSCSFSVPRSPIRLTANTTRLRITVGASSRSCRWTATSEVDWITVESGSPNTGRAAVIFLVAANTSTQSRTATVIIAGKPVTIVQRGQR